MVAHGSLHVLHTEFAVGHNPQRHLLGLCIFAQSPRQIAREIVGETIEEAPHTRIAETTTREIGRSIDLFPREISILAREPSLRTRKSDGIGAEEHILLVVLIEFSYAALVGMSANGIIRNAHRHPNHFLATRATAHHLHDPSLVGVAEGERLATAIETIGVGQRRHHLNGLASRARTLQCDINEAAII